MGQKDKKDVNDKNDVKKSPFTTCISFSHSLTYDSACPMAHNALLECVR